MFNLLEESKTLFENLDRHFLRHYKWQYHILVVDNHLFNCFSFFLQARRVPYKLVHSYDLLEISHKKGLYQQILHDLKQHTKLTIEYRDTHHLVHPGQDIKKDLAHGHHASTTDHSRNRTID